MWGNADDGEEWPERASSGRAQGGTISRARADGSLILLDTKLRVLMVRRVGGGSFASATGLRR